jgi:hypothetical protein
MNRLQQELQRLYDVPPNPDRQAQLLAPLKSIQPAEFELALQRLRPAAVQVEPRLGTAGVPLSFLIGELEQIYEDG